MIETAAPTVVKIFYAIGGYILGLGTVYIKERIRGQIDRGTADHQGLRAKRVETVEGLMSMLPKYLKSVTALVSDLGKLDKSEGERHTDVERLSEELEVFYFRTAWCLPETVRNEVASYLRFLRGKVQEFDRICRNPTGNRIGWGELSDTVRERGVSDLAVIEREFRNLLKT